MSRSLGSTAGKEEVRFRVSHKTSGSQRRISEAGSCLQGAALKVAAQTSAIRERDPYRRCNRALGGDLGGDVSEI